jgi:hypothetical protein
MAVHPRVTGTDCSAATAIVIDCRCALKCIRWALCYNPTLANPPYPPLPPQAQSTCTTLMTVAAASWPFVLLSHHTLRSSTVSTHTSWQQGRQLLLYAHDVGVLSSLEHLSLISEYSLSDDSRNSILPAHSFAESVLLMRLAYCAVLPLLSTVIHNYNTMRPTTSSMRLNNHDFDVARYDELNMMLTLFKELLNWIVELHLHPAPHLAHHQPSCPLYMWAHLPQCKLCQQHFKLQQL